ncbi:MAG TPA: MFS transporter [Chloroflexota bacterium]|nr:MFS transporter [Chloroflexota bacterium]
MASSRPTPPNVLPIPAARMGTFSSIQGNPNFRLYWLGAFVSNVGTWMQSVAQGWLVYQLTGSTLLLGAVSFAGSIPILFLSLFGGALADRFERRRLMIVTQIGLMILAFLLSALTFARMITVWQIMAIAFCGGVVNAFNAPVRQSLIADLVPRNQLQNAIALNSAQFQSSRVFGPAIAGVTLAAAGPAWCFFVNGASFLAVIAALMLVVVPPLPARRPQSIFRNVQEGLQYVWREPTIFALLLVATIPGLFGQPYQPMLPAVVSSVLHYGATGLGFLESSAGAGSVVGALIVASLAQSKRRGRLQLYMLTLFGIGLILFSESRWMPLSMAMVFIIGLASMAYSSLNQTFLHSLVTDEMRGRLMSIFTLTTFGLQPLGALQAGFIGQSFGVTTALFGGGVVCLLVSIVAMRAKRAGLEDLA